jgi:hypothetical protein
VTADLPRTPSSKLKSFTLKVSASILILAVFGWALSASIDLAVIKNIDWQGIYSSFLFSTLVFVVMQVLRALRLSYMIGHNYKSFGDLYPISAIHAFAVFMLPFRAGEMALPLLLKSTGRKSLAEGVGITLILRVMDAAALLLVIVISSFAGVFTPLGFDSYITWLSILGIAVIIAFFILANRGLGSRIASLTKSRKIEAIVRGLFASTKVIRVSTQILLFGLTVLIWTAQISACYIAASGVVQNIEFGSAIAAALAGTIAFFQPVNGIAQAGPFHSAWALTLSSYGVLWDIAVVSAIVVHAAALVAVSLQAGLVTVFARSWQKSDTD